MTTQTDIVISKIIPAPPETVFEAWLDPEALARFMKPAESVTIAKAEIDAREGGEFLIVMVAGDKEMPHRGEYREIKRHERLVFSWLSHMAGAGSLVTITFAESGSGQTELILRHAGLETEAARTGHEGGWTRIIETLAGDVD
jgi:uncharacterized protein YndB with AHSA1/START domain